LLPLTARRDCVCMAASRPPGCESPLFVQQQQPDCASSLCFGLCESVLVLFVGKENLDQSTQKQAWQSLGGVGAPLGRSRGRSGVLRFYIQEEGRPVSEAGKKSRGSCTAQNELECWFGGGRQPTGGTFRFHGSRGVVDSAGPYSKSFYKSLFGVALLLDSGS
jgi:hypothetical protein